MRALVAWLVWAVAATMTAAGLFLILTSGAGPRMLAGTQAWLAALGLAFVAWLATPPAPGNRHLRVATRGLLFAVGGVSAFVLAWFLVVRPPFG